MSASFVDSAEYQRDHARDEVFDRVYPEWVRSASDVYWTPLAVAEQASKLLVAEKGTRVLDVGSGVGKFCLVGAMTTEGVFTGVEQRAHLVEIARAAAQRYEIPRCRFIAGNAVELDWSRFDAFYLYNPFAEHRPGSQRLDDTIDVAPERYKRYVAFVTAALEQARAGTRVVTYCGFGGGMPAGWLQVESRSFWTNPVTLWVKSPIGVARKRPRRKPRSAAPGSDGKKRR